MQNEEDFSVLLVVPPFYAYGQPCLGTAILKSALSKKGISSKVFYANALYANLVGLDHYRTIMSVVSPTEIYQEQIFAKKAHQGGVFAVSSKDDPDNFYARYYSMFTNKKTTLTDQEFMDAEGQVDGFIDKFVEEVKRIKPKIVGFSSLYYQTNATLAMAKQLKKAMPEIVAVMGGNNCYPEMGEELAKYKSIDYIFDGEADITFPDFCSKVLKESRLPDEKIIRCLPVQDLDQLDIPDYSDFMLQFAPEERKDSLLYFETSRGCWWGAKHRCKFCGIADNVIDYRTKTATKAALQICQMREKYPEYKSYYACDSVFPDSFFNAFFEALSSGNFDGTIFYQIKPMLNFEQLKKMKESGIDTLGPGIESLSTKHLALMKKGTTAAINIALLRNCKELNITAKWNHLVALPKDSGEDYKSLALLFPLVQHLDPPVITPIYIQRFSPYFKNHEEHGISNLRPMEGYSKAFPENLDLMKLAYQFDGEIDSHIRKTPELLIPFFTAIRKWYQRWSTDPAELFLYRQNGKILVKDTRDCAVDEITEIEENELDMLKYCHTPRKKEKIKDNVTNLRSRGYLIEIDDCLLSLVCGLFGV